MKLSEILTTGLTLSGLSCLAVLTHGIAHEDGRKAGVLEAKEQVLNCEELMVETNKRMAACVDGKEECVEELGECREILETAVE